MCIYFSTNATVRACLSLVASCSATMFVCIALYCIFVAERIKYDDDDDVNVNVNDDTMMTSPLPYSIARSSGKYKSPKALI